MDELLKYREAMNGADLDTVVKDLRSDPYEYQGMEKKLKKMPKVTPVE